MTKDKILRYSKNNLIQLRIVPNSSKNELIFEENRIKVKIKSIPEDGKANSELIKFFKKNGLKIEILKGLKSREKFIKIL